MYDTSQFRRGLKIEFKNEPYSIVEFQHVKPGKGGAFVRTKLKNLISGKVLEQTFRSGEKVDEPDLEEKEMQFLYRDAQGFQMMNTNTYEEETLVSEAVGEAGRFLQESLTINVLYYRARPVTVELPLFVELAVTQTDPGVKGDTASGGNKPATLETGAVVQVPLFIAEGDTLKIDTRSGEYIERVH